MSRGINKVTIVGNLGDDPEVKYLPSGGAVTNISVATSESWKDKQTGEQKEKVEWHRIVFFNRLAEIAGEYLKKGSQVYVEGSLRTRKWQAQDGSDRYSTEIIGNEMQMLGGRAGTANEQDKEQIIPLYPKNGESGLLQVGDGNSGRQGASGSLSQKAAHRPTPPAQNMDGFDSDIPF